MNTKLLSNEALSVIDQYLNFRFEQAVCSVPYYINKHLQLHGALRVLVGKGSPKEIFDEVKSISIKEKIPVQNLDSQTFKKFLVDENIGIDCSGLAYYILNAESESLGKKSLDHHLSFPLCKGIFGKMKCKIRPVENAGVSTFAHNENSKVISLKDIQPGDIITMLKKMDEKENGPERNHILVIHQIEYQNFVPTIVHYTHSIAWPADGEYGHGVRQGTIEILDSNKTITEQKWIEKDKMGSDDYTLSQALTSTTELRRLNWF